MTLTKRLFLIAVVMGLAVHGAATAGDYEYVGTATLCTGTCNSFASFDVGSILTGNYTIATAPNGAWDFTDVSGFSAQIFNPSAPSERFNGTNPTTANPLPITAITAPIRSFGGGLTTGGTTDSANGLSSGNILQEFGEPPFSSNGAWLIFTIDPGSFAVAQICLFYGTSGCIPSATETMVIDGQFILPPDLFSDGFETP